MNIINKYKFISKTIDITIYKLIALAYTYNKANKSVTIAQNIDSFIEDYQRNLTSIIKNLNKY